MDTVKVTLCRGAVRDGYCVREGELGAQPGSKARQRPQEPGPCPASKVKAWSKPGNGSQAQPRVQITRHICGDELGLKLSHEIRSGSGLVMVTRIRHRPQVTMQVRSDAARLKSR